MIASDAGEGVADHAALINDAAAPELQGHDVAFPQEKSSNRSCGTLRLTVEMASATEPASNVMPTQNPRKYLAFDIETAKELPGDFSLWRNHRPLGIVCAATCASDAEPKLWHSKTDTGAPARRMTRADVRQLVDYLCVMASQGHTLLTWNGASFDFDVLQEESGAHAACKACAHDHVDMMFHLVCLLGYPISLAKVAEGLSIPGKTAGMSGGEAPRLWAKGEYDKVLAYVAQDVRLALQIAAECEKLRQIAWITQKGSRKTEQLPGGWLSVREALKLKLPDTSWMSKPLKREEFLAWMAER